MSSPPPPYWPSEATLMAADIRNPWDQGYILRAYESLPEFPLCTTAYREIIEYKVLPDLGVQILSRSVKDVPTRRGYTLGTHVRYTPVKMRQPGEVVREEVVFAVYPDGNSGCLSRRELPAKVEEKEITLASTEDSTKVSEEDVSKTKQGNPQDLIPSLSNSIHNPSRQVSVSTSKTEAYSERRKLEKKKPGDLSDSGIDDCFDSLSGSNFSSSDPTQKSDDTPRQRIPHVQYHSYHSVHQLEPSLIGGIITHNSVEEPSEDQKENLFWWSTQDYSMWTKPFSTSIAACDILQAFRKKKSRKNSSRVTFDLTKKTRDDSQSENAPESSKAASLEVQSELNRPGLLGSKRAANIEMKAQNRLRANSEDKSAFLRDPRGHEILNMLRNQDEDEISSQLLFNRVITLEDYLEKFLEGDFEPNDGNFQELFEILGFLGRAGCPYTSHKIVCLMQRVLSHKQKRGNIRVKQANDLKKWSLVIPEYKKPATATTLKEYREWKNNYHFRLQADHIRPALGTNTYPTPQQIHREVEYTTLMLRNAKLEYFSMYFSSMTTGLKTWVDELIETNKDLKSQIKESETIKTNETRKQAENRLQELLVPASNEQIDDARSQSSPCDSSEWKQSLRHRLHILGRNAHKIKTRKAPLLETKTELDSAVTLPEAASVVTPAHAVQQERPTGADILESAADGWIRNVEESTWRHEMLATDNAGEFEEHQADQLDKMSKTLLEHSSRARTNSKDSTSSSEITIKEFSESVRNRAQAAGLLPGQQEALDRLAAEQSESARLAEVLKEKHLLKEQQKVIDKIEAEANADAEKQRLLIETQGRIAIEKGKFEVATKKKTSGRRRKLGFMSSRGISGDSGVSGMSTRSSESKPLKQNAKSSQSRPRKERVTSSESKPWNEPNRLNRSGYWTQSDK